MLPERTFEFGQAELHLQNRRSEGFTEFAGLLRRAPIREIRQCARGVFDDNLLYAILKSVCPDQEAFDTGRVWRDHAHRRESHVGGRDILMHRIVPVGGNLAGEMIGYGTKSCSVARAKIDQSWGSAIQW